MILKEKDKLLVGKFLKEIPAFRNLSDKRVEQIINDFTICTFHAGETVFYQTDKSTDMYIILAGKVKVSLLSEEGDEFVLTELNQGDFFGEISLIDGNPRSASVIAEEDSTFAVLERTRFLDAIKEDPEIAIDLLKSLVQRLRNATEREESLAFLAVHQRLVKLFIKLIKDEGKKTKNGFYLIKKRTHKEIAERIGASRESISKVIKRLVSGNLITENGELFLLSPDLFKDIDELTD
ncbi:Potassium efflux system KefA protein / Small-conductance mechanosensitive channel [hydrothermal vent metagenome]|uniref:Potassium efflux system KefA protein / Small-conductance mechanosensitive channel n=1 Tax=hydrothermal vent metagenome TaxID=652676 RepID=A0A3B1D175_9ZZZZ